VLQLHTLQETTSLYLSIAQCVVYVAKVVVHFFGEVRPERSGDQEYGTTCVVDHTLAGKTIDTQQEESAATFCVLRLNEQGAGVHTSWYSAKVPSIATGNI
jgi:hypothetical protein